MKKALTKAVLVSVVTMAVGCSTVEPVEPRKPMVTVDPPKPIVTNDNDGYCEHNYDSKRNFKYEKTEIYKYTTFGKTTTTYAFTLPDSTYTVFLSSDEVQNYTCHLIE